VLTDSESNYFRENRKNKVIFGDDIAQKMQLKQNFVKIDHISRNFEFLGENENRHFRFNPVCNSTLVTEVCLTASRFVISPFRQTVCHVQKMQLYIYILKYTSLCKFKKRNHLTEKMPGLDVKLDEEEDPQEGQIHPL
jgi:hypothetical protein